MQCNRVVIEAQNHPGTNLIGARPAQDIQEIKEPDSIVYQAAEQTCDKISCKQANYMMVMGRNPANPLKYLRTLGVDGRKPTTTTTTTTTTTFLHPVIVIFSQHMTVPAQPVLLQYQCYVIYP